MKNPSEARSSTSLAPYALLAPFLAVTVTFFAYPLVDALWLAFYQTNGPKTQRFVGIGNFVYLLHDPDFARALFNSAVFAAASIATQIPLALLLAVMLHQVRGRARGVVRLVLISPNLVGAIFVGVLFSVMLTPRYGIINRALAATIGWGLDRRWLEEPSLAMPAMVMASLWMYVGFNVVYFLAALEGVDPSLREAASIDGAGPLQIFRHVTLPALRPVLGFVTLSSIIGSFQVFELPLVLFLNTSGYGPDRRGLTVLTYLNEIGFNQGDLGLASAVGWILTLLLLAVSVTHLRLTAARGEA